MMAAASRVAWQIFGERDWSLLSVELCNQPHAGCLDIVRGREDPAEDGDVDLKRLAER